MKEDRNPFQGVSVVSDRAAAQFVSAVDVPDELSAAERGDDAGFADAVRIRIHSYFLYITLSARTLPWGVYPMSGVWL